MIRSTWFRLNRHDEPTVTPPVPPTPGAPAGQPTSTPPGPDPATPVDVAALPANVQKLISDLRTENGKHRTDKQTATQQAEQYKNQVTAILKAAGLNPDGTTADDPAAAAAQLKQRAEDAEAAAFNSSVQFNVHRAATELGGDPARLLDSMAFIDSLDDMTATDPTSPEFATEVKAKVAAAIERNPAYKVTPTGPRNPAPDPGQGRGGNNGPADFTKASKEEFAAELAKYGLRPKSHS